MSQQFQEPIIDFQQFKNATQATLGYFEAPSLVGADAIGRQSAKSAYTYSVSRGSVLWQVPIATARMFIDPKAMRKLCAEMYKFTGAVKSGLTSQF